MSDCRLEDSKLYVGSRIVCDLLNTDPSQLRYYMSDKFTDQYDELFELVLQFYNSQRFKHFFFVV
jgi:hypothetical protein